jgi:hypothetical protein
LYLVKKIKTIDKYTNKACSETEPSRKEAQMWDRKSLANTGLLNLMRAKAGCEYYQAGVRMRESMEDAVRMVLKNTGCPYDEEDVRWFLSQLGKHLNEHPREKRVHATTTPRLVRHRKERCEEPPTCF